MEFKLAPLPYEKDALEPFIGAQTVDIHYEKHHGGYVTKLNAALADDPLREEDLDSIIMKSSGGVYNLAAQIWNHDFYWRSISPDEVSISDATLQQKLDAAFGSVDAFKEQFSTAAATQFGSGWAWLVLDPASGDLQITSTSDAINPMNSGQVPLLTLDVWEHAYYLDYKNDRPGYIKAFIDAHINWAYAEENLRNALAG